MRNFGETYGGLVEELDWNTDCRSHGVGLLAQG